MHTGSGPSPRVRGSRGGDITSYEALRSIPACAGEPRRPVRCRSRYRVHPRVCGGARMPERDDGGPAGPSPRVRGSRHVDEALSRAVGSIPACAGEPCSTSASSRRTKVHPRVCGGAISIPPSVRIISGPSPRVRGSPEPRRSSGGARRSIPACAGEPARTMIPAFSTGVHPRVCGGAGSGCPVPRHGHGPSPRVRGSPEPHSLLVPAGGSIPACAGEPPGKYIG